MFCPQCKSEYLPPVARCSDCNVPLVEHLPETFGDSHLKKNYDDPLYRALGKWVATVASTLASVFLFIALEGKPFGFQIASVVTYTGAVSFFIFCDSRGTKGYSLRNEIVQQQLLRLSGVHAVFLVALLVGLKFAFWIKPRLSLFWVVERGSSSRHSSLYLDVLIVASVALCFTEVWISRGMLGRALKDKKTSGTSVAF